MTSPTRDQILAIAIETSGRLGSVALSRGPRLVEAAVLSADQRHAVELLPTIDFLCRRHGVNPGDVDEVYVSAGPGSFTGLRVGIIVARTLAWAAGVGVVLVPTLDVIAQNALELPDPPRHLAVVLDAKRRRVYAAAFELRGNAYHRLADPAEVDVEEFASTLAPGCCILGEGVAYHRAAIQRTAIPVLPDGLNRARAEVVGKLGFARASADGFNELAALVPTYIRRPEAEEVWERRHGAD